MGVILYVLSPMKNSVECVLVIPLGISAGASVYCLWELIPGKEDVEVWKGISCNKGSMGNFVTKSAVCKWCHSLWTKYANCTMW
jgi:hypothetical protein